MKAPKLKILLCGDQISKDSTLHELLGKIGEVIVFSTCETLGPVDEIRQSKLVIMEFSEEGASKELYRLQEIYYILPEANVIVIDRGENRSAIIETFKSGAKDYFKQPYNRELLAERVEAILSVEN